MSEVTNSMEGRAPRSILRILMDYEDYTRWLKEVSKLAEIAFKIYDDPVTMQEIRKYYEEGWKRLFKWSYYEQYNSHHRYLPRIFESPTLMGMDLEYAFYESVNYKISLEDFYARIEPYRQDVITFINNLQRNIANLEEELKRSYEIYFKNFSDEGNTYYGAVIEDPQVKTLFIKFILERGIRKT